MSKSFLTNSCLLYFLQTSNDKAAKTFQGAVFQCSTVFTQTLPSIPEQLVGTVSINALLEKSWKPFMDNLENIRSMFLLVKLFFIYLSLDNTRRKETY